MRYLLLMLTMLASTSQAYAFDRQKMLDSFFSTVMVRGYKADGSLAYGSGVVVSDKKVLTNCHIFRETKQAWVSQGETSYPITSIQSHPSHDLCLLGFDDLPIKPVAIGNGDLLKKGQEVVSIGHSSGVPTPLTSIGVAKSLYEMDNSSIIRSTARFALGASGSGLYNSEGQLIGISTFKTAGRVAYYYAVPIAWLADLEIQPTDTKLPVSGSAFWEAEAAKKPFFMQVAVPELAENWTQLAEIANQWVKAEPGSTEAWYELGLANEKLGNHGEAEAAYRKSVALDSTNTDSLFRIGMIAVEKGNQDEVRAINMTLLNIDKTIANEFSNAAGCAGTCK